MSEAESASDGTPEELQLHILNHRMDPHRLVYGTIILMTAFALYDVSADPVPLRALPIITLSGVVIAPLFALTMAHAFSEALDMQIRKKAHLTKADRRHLLASNLQYLYLAIPPVALVVVLSLLGLEPASVVLVVQVVGLASLFAWGYYAGSKAQLSHPRRFIMGSGYFIAGLVVLAIELALTH